MRYLSRMTLLSLSLFISPLFIHAETDKKSIEITPTDPPITINACPTIAPTIAPTFTNAPIFTPNYSPTFEPHFNNYVYSLSHAVGMKIKNITIIWLEQIKKKMTLENYDLAKILIKNILWNYRYTITGSVVVGSYSTTGILLLADYHYVNDSATWSRWKQECTFEDLCAIPQKELARELLLAVGQRYYNEKNPTDLAHPLIQFLNNIDTEIATLKRYIRTTKIIKRLRLITIFPTNETKIGNAQHLLERALFIKHIFLSWLSEYNLVSNDKNKQP